MGKSRWNIILFKSNPDFPGANELTTHGFNNGYRQASNISQNLAGN